MSQRPLLNKSPLFAVPVGGPWLLFAPGANVASLLSTAGVEALRRYYATGETLPPAIAPLADAIASKETKTEPTTPYLGLILTRDCGMACRYCDFGSSEKNDGAMPQSLIVGAIEDWAERTRRLGGRRLALHLFGGEPFDEPGLVELAVNRLREVAGRLGLDAHVDATTNGLFARGGLEFAREHLDSLAVSLDGIGADHDRHRPLKGGIPSFGIIDQNLRRLRGGRVAVSLRCCVSSANADNLANIAREFAERYAPAMIDFEPMHTATPKTGIGLSASEPMAFARSFIAARRAASLFGIPCGTATLFDPSKGRFCPANGGAYIVTPAGNVRSCYLPAERWRERGLDFEIGRASANGLEIASAAHKRITACSAETPACDRCLAQPGCQGGCLLRPREQGNTECRTMFCRQTRLVQSCVLLDNLGRPDLTDQLLSDSPAHERFSRTTDDTLAGCDTTIP